MKYLVIFGFLTILSGCAGTGVQKYHSESEIPTESKLVLSNLKFVRTTNNMGSIKGLGVFSATDNDTVNYLVFAPVVSEGVNKNHTPYERFDVVHGSVINEEETENLIEALRETVNNWSESYEFEMAKFIEFVIVQEHQKIQVTQNVTVYEPEVRYICQITKNGPQAKIWYGRSPGRNSVVFKSVDQVIFLLEKIERAKGMWPVKVG